MQQDTRAVSSLYRTAPLKMPAAQPAVHEMRSDERRAQTAAAREQLQAKLDELQRRFDERAAALGRTRKSLLRGNPTARSERYTEVLERLKKRLDTHTHR